MARNLTGATVVITGASSGNGRATALEFAGHGSKLVLNARNSEALEEVAWSCRGHGASVIADTGDVARPEDMERLARKAVQHFGRIDVWINNAGVFLMGRLEDAPAQALHRLIETNLVGYMNGARAALPILRRQGKGVLINNISFGGRVPIYLAAAYTASKFGAMGLTEALELELLDMPKIRVCALLPLTVDTPGIRHAANYTGNALKPPNPVFSSRRVARAMVSLARRPRRVLYVGTGSRILTGAYGILPGLTGRFIRRMQLLDNFQRRSTGPTEGNLFRSIPPMETQDKRWAQTGEILAKSWPLAGLVLGYAARRRWLG